MSYLCLSQVAHIRHQGPSTTTVQHFNHKAMPPPEKDTHNLSTQTSRMRVNLFADSWCHMILFMLQRDVFIQNGLDGRRVKTTYRKESEVFYMARILTANERLKFAPVLHKIKVNDIENANIRNRVKAEHIIH